ncbi:MAG: glycosyltransferase family 2 protein [Alphaproteobacteria bacterium]|nr:glycosyltransferase family 2 protein [Alphaproteobacteria bacterium]
MNKSPKISVIIPAYKTAKYIPACLDSVLAQTFTDIEIICINDGSPDNALEVFNEYAARDSRIRVMNQENQGICFARNNAIATARADYIFPLDSDDMIAPNCLEYLYNIITSKPKYSVVCPMGIRFDATPGMLWKLPPINYFNMYGGRNGVHNSSLFPKKLWEKYGGYCVELNRLGGEDYDFWLCFLDDNRKIYRTKLPLFFYRIKPTAESRNRSGTKERGEQIKKIRMARHPRIVFYTGLQYIRNPFRGIRKLVRTVRKKLKNK